MTPGQRKTIDRSNYYDVLVNFDRQLTASLEIVENALTKLDSFKKRSWSEVIICGMGGSAIAGDFVKNMLFEEAPCPILVNRDYSLPHFVGKNTLVLTSSYSGNTEETLAAAKSAIQKKASVITFATGGKLTELAIQNEFPVVSLPEGFQPRQAIGYSLTCLYGILRWLMTGNKITDEIEASIRTIRSLTSDIQDKADNHPLFQQAAMMKELPVIVYSSEKFLPAAVRLKGQICENGKQLAFAYPVPEMNHNEIVGWEKTTTPFAVVFIRDNTDHPQVQKRFDIMERLLTGKTVIKSYRGEGNTVAERFYSLINQFDWLSYFHALTRGIDPTPVDIITQLKKELGS